METFSIMVYPMSVILKEQGETSDRISLEDLSKEEQRMYEISSIFVEKGFFDFSIGGIDNEAIINTESNALISLYDELVSIVKKRGGFSTEVLTKLYRTFSDEGEMDKAVQFMRYANNQGYKGSTVDDLDIPNDTTSKLKKDFESEPNPSGTPSDGPTLAQQSQVPIKVRKRTPGQKKQDLMHLTTTYLKDVLKLDDDEIFRRVDILFGSVETEKGRLNETEELNEQILRDFKRFL